MTTHKDIDPRGFLLNDNDIGVDHLGESTIADAIAESLHHVETPITIGLYAKWGSGKSFLLRHIESILKRFQKQQEIIDEKRERLPDQNLVCRHACRAVLWSVIIIVIFLILLVTILLAVKPSFITGSLGFKLPNPDDDNDSVARNVNITLTTTSPPAVEQQKPQILSTLRIVGLVLLPIELMLVFVIGCFGNSWLSPGYYGSARLLTYGAFTKLPLRNFAKDIVEDPGESPAKVLQHIKPGDERLAISAAENSILPRKYMFVDFKAWEYTGSDTLWAAIVTKITDAIEEEFGVITARTFRMLQIEEVDPNLCRNSARTLYIESIETASYSDVMDMMQQYGVVKCCTRVEKSRYWRIEYCTDGECRNAKEFLKIEGVPFLFDCHPKMTAEELSLDGSFQRDQTARESRKKLIEMKDLSGKAAADVDDADLERWSYPPKERCCNRFCCHFVKHPTKILCLPKLVWWILIFSCALLIPIVAYIVADYFGLDIYRTYRAVPVYGQILLWLPAAGAVGAFVVRFMWAMLHSQRKRINAALDGTQNKMAEKLGFMSKIEVVTKLIHCAKFTHQKDYKIVITIDDLDRIPLRQVHSVLEAVSILLSDISAPFICLIAADSRVVVKCIEDSFGEALRESRITGHEYLKKIINLPICLPEINNSNKKRFLAGLIDQADKTVTYRKEEERPRKGKRRSIVNTPARMPLVRYESSAKVTRIQIASPTESDGSLSSGEEQIDAKMYTYEADVHVEKPTRDPNDNIPGFVRKDSSQSTTTTNMQTTRIAGPNGHVPGLKVTDLSNPIGSSPVTVTRTSNPIRNGRYGADKEKEESHIKKVEVELDHKNFLFECRSYIYENEDLHKHIQGNPRNIKRLFNVISLTASIINSFLKKRQRRNFIKSHFQDCVRMEKDSCKKLKRTKELAQDVVRWVILTDQWPYRASYILQVIEDANQRHSAGINREQIPEDWTIYEIYENKVKDECLKGESWLLSLDGDPDLFFSYLLLLKDGDFTAEKMLELENYTMNLDYSIRHAIALQRDISPLSLEPATPVQEDISPAHLRDDGKAITQTIIEKTLESYQPAPNSYGSRPNSWHNLLVHT